MCVLFLYTVVDKDPSGWYVILVSKKGSILSDSISTVTALGFQWSLGVAGSAGPCLGVELLMCYPHTFSRKVVVVNRWTMLSSPHPP